MACATKSAPNTAATNVATSVRLLSTPKLTGLASRASPIAPSPATARITAAVKPAPTQLPDSRARQWSWGAAGAVVGNTVVGAAAGRTGAATIG